MHNSSKHDPVASFNFVKAQVEYYHDRGELSREEAKQIIDGARKGYREHKYERAMERKRGE